MEDKDGIMRKLCIQQGYVPVKCTLDGFLIMALIHKQEDPCAGCNEDRGMCGGRLKNPLQTARDARYAKRVPKPHGPPVWDGPRDLSVLKG